jgi:hypothetical protein
MSRIKAGTPARDKLGPGKRDMLDPGVDNKVWILE